MRERERCGRGSTMKVVVMVMVMMVMMVTGVVKVAEATPAVTSSLHHHHHHHEEAVGPTSMQANHVEDTYLDDALDDWLNNFETYTFMVKQDLDSHHDEEEAEGGEEEGVEAGTEEQEEVDEDEEQHVKEEEWSAPIAVSVGSKSLLDPHLDYLVTVESLVAEEGSIFLTLSKYKNQTECGVGGFTVEAAMRSPLPPRRAVARGESNSAGGGGGIEEQSNASTTFIAFDLQYEGNMSLPDTSAWAEVSEDYWWARGRLAGGGMLSITFTPPECGCLSLSTYYALPVGNLTLVVGPQAYPEELQVLLCIDPLAVAPVQEEYDEEEEEEEEGDVGEYLQEPSALVAPRTTEAGVTEVEEEGDAETSPDEQPPVVTPRRRKGPRGERRKAKKNRRQMKRQRIRQAGRRQARRQQRQQQRQEEEEDEDEEEGEEGAPGVKKGRRRWKQKRRGKKVWRKIKKGRKGRRKYHGAKHHHLHHDDDENENTTDHHHHHQHPHPHAIHGQNTSAATQQEERLIDILLRDTPTENSTEAEHHEEDVPVGDGSGNGEAEVGTEEQEGAEDNEAAMTPRQRRKNRRQRKKMMRKERKKAHPPGIKFCCKQGVKHKKNILEFNSTSESSPAPCNSTSEVVSTFANHQFGIEVDACDHTYAKCCTGFTAEMWNSIKAKKMARRMERKQRRKFRRQGRKHRRQNERRMRKEMKRQYSRHHEEAEEEAEAGQEEQGEGEAVVE